MTARRADLLALTPDALAALTNRGLLKRAAKAVDAGDGPEVGIEPDGTLTGEHPDGVRTRIGAGADLDAADCDCGAPGACRHVLTLVLAYQATAAAAAAPTGPAAAGPVPAGGRSGGTAPADAVPGSPPPTAPAVPDWSPGEFGDDEIEALIGSRALVLARRTHRRGYNALVRRPTAVDPAPLVELPSCTVRFLVPHQLNYAHTAAASGAHGEAVALAVWACRVADETAPGVAETRVEVGGATAGADGSGLTAALELADEVLLDGAVNSGGLAAGFAVVRRDLEAANLRWPLLALDDLAGQLTAYRERSAHHHPERVAELLAELHARHRAVTGAGAGARSRVLGTEEAAETPLRRVRLTGLGCRVAGTAEDRTVEVFLAQADSPTVLVLRHRWPVADGTGPTGPEIAGRRVGGATVGALAAGNLVTESAARSAAHRVRLATRRIAATTVSPSSGAWRSLADGLVVRDLAGLAAALEALPPRMIRPRVDAESFRVVEVADVRSIGYRPGDQRLDAVVADPTGGTATVSAVHRAVSPGALEALAAALRGDRGRPRFVSGAVHRTRGGLVVVPAAVAVDGAVVVPDLAGGDDRGQLAPGVAAVADELGDAVDAALGLLAELAHRGARHVPVTFPGRLRAAGRTLAGIGLRRSAEALEGLAAGLAADPTSVSGAWVDAQIRLSVTADRR
ncbi:hypothetical protein [Polymorphospora rubra]|uniref:SWIM-type domain-containing protein n=1 Tax=Polymorphospora rubra TaxID=338584 RepID=A0A810N6I9_9ACTN|nr:hypothetical protein [Polymorphospora rubra]BCJ69026.1 hypothetical protein Prubr_60470 [Polymorphospora rubra]